ncbi:hypothetical protein DI273_12005 [Streptomyces violascens]|nr:hypothetical protein DI273_12005 [Streptomyces violascens]
MCPDYVRRFDELAQRVVYGEVGACGPDAVGGLLCLCSKFTHVNEPLTAMNKGLCLVGGLLRPFQGYDKRGLLCRNPRFGKSGALRRQHPTRHAVFDGALSQQSSGGTRLVSGQEQRRIGVSP